MNALALMATLGLDTSNYEQGLKGAGGMAQSFASSFKKVLGGVAVAGGAAVTAAGAAVVKIVKSAVTAYADYEQLVGGVETLFGNGGKSYEQFAEGAADSMYQMGQRGEDVKRIQEEINKTLADGEKLAVDGIYGPKTRAALDAYAKAGGEAVKSAYDGLSAASDKVIANAKNAYMTAGLDANTYMDTVTGFSASLLQSLGGDTNKAADLADQAIVDMSDNANKMGTNIDSIMVAYQGFAKQNYTINLMSAA